MAETITGDVPRVYIETSVWGMTLPKQPRALREPTRKFLRQCRLGLFSPVISNVVLQEIDSAPTQVASRLLAEIGKVACIQLAVNEDCERLARRYLQEGVVPEKKRFDALHVAVATFGMVDFLVSWNHRHLANDRKRELFNAINLLAGCNPLRIHTPLEVMR